MPANLGSDLDFTTYPVSGSNLTLTSQLGDTIILYPNCRITMTLNTLPAAILGVLFYAQYTILNPAGTAVYRGSLLLNLAATNTLSFPWANSTPATINVQIGARWQDANGQVVAIVGSQLQTSYTPNLSNINPDWSAITPADSFAASQPSSPIPGVQDATLQANQQVLNAAMAFYPLQAAPNAVSFGPMAYAEVSANGAAPIQVVMTLSSGDLPLPQLGVSCYLKYNIQGPKLNGVGLASVYQGTMPLNLNATNILIFQWPNNVQATVNISTLAIWLDVAGNLQTSLSDVRTQTETPSVSDLNVSQPGLPTGSFGAVLLPSTQLQQL